MLLRKFFLTQDDPSAEIPKLLFHAEILHYQRLLMTYKQHLKYAVFYDFPFGVKYSYVQINDFKLSGSIVNLHQNLNLMNLYKAVVRPFLFRFPADYAHELTIDAASYASEHKWITKPLKKIYQKTDPRLHQKIWGLHFDNPVGLAAGFDKNGTTIHLMEALGFGYVEIGSISANACTGNPKPRSFRLAKDQSLINRLGLNNDGAKTVVKRLKRSNLNIPLGVNIAKTHNQEISGLAALQDYSYSFSQAKKVADYITINISCPNTTEGKTFEDPELLNRLLSHLEVGNDASDPPVLIKLSVDLDNNNLEELLNVSERFAVSGYVATNTSSKREGLITDTKTLDNIGSGGLSGKPIREKSTDIIRRIYNYTKGEKTVIGVGGIFTAEDAIEKFKAGADLIQIYTGMVYEGPGIVKAINSGIKKYLEEHDLKNVYQIRS